MSSAESLRLIARMFTAISRGPSQARARTAFPAVRCGATSCQAGVWRSTMVCSPSFRLWLGPAVLHQPYLPNYRQSVLPVHFLGLAPLLDGIGPVAGDVKLEDDGVVHNPADCRGGGHGVGEDTLAR